MAGEFVVATIAIIGDLYCKTGLKMAATVVHPEIVARFRTGDPDAVQAMYDGYGRLVYSIAYRILGNRSLAEDASQQTFLQAWRSSATFDADRDPAPWLATIARRAAIDIQRAERRRTTVPLGDADINDSALVVLPPSAEELWEAWQVRAAIDSLADDERDVVRLQHLDGLTQVEIATHLGIAVGTVKSRSFRAHRSLATRLRSIRTVDES